ncbi:hypothetical protein D5S17_21090 [Pseudonocardiaceae bacterium YIM PH 21723]|nr:hypothetical protein D5S17_21090 [Pseudonocardiaceae bacterium YIM PH 21723]
MEAVVGRTDRGVLWRAGREQPHDRIVRIVKSRFVDGAFRQAVTGLGQRRPAGMVEITGHDWTADGHYYIEYGTDETWRTLGERLAELPDWQDRVELLDRVCSLFERWQRSPVFPLGLNLHNIIVVAEDGHWYPWLVPCPVVTPVTPRDLFGVDAVALAAVAPEIVRGLQQDSKAADAYALGTLVAQALGTVDARPDMSDEERVEAQARGILWPSLTADSRLPAALGDIRAGEDLVRVVERHRQGTSFARPVPAADLRSALATLKDPVAIARQLRPVNPGRAMDVLDEVPARDGQTRIEAALFGAEIAEEHQELDRMLRYLDIAVEVAPHRFDLRDRRYRAAWRLFESLPPGRRRNELGSVIILDIALLDPAMPEGDDRNLRRRAAEVHLGCGSPAAAARELFVALERDPGDLDALFLYSRCWVELGDIPNARRTIAETRRRISRMVDTQILTPGEAQQWLESFDRLLP